MSAATRLLGGQWAAMLATLLVLGACKSATEAAPISASPSSARIVTEDIPRFWTAFDEMQSSSDTIPLRRDYLDPGTVGLKEFTNARWKDAKTLAAMVWPRRDYYASVRANTLTVSSFEPEIRRIYRSLDSMYSDAVFPDVYFAIGGLGTGGTTSQHGLLIGTELFSRAPDSPLSALTPWQRAVVQPLEILPTIVAHELTHYQQRYTASTSTLLAQSIREGGADFVSELLTGKTINQSIHSYGDAHERELWLEFSADMNGTDVSRWLYNGGSVTATADRPADLGYYVGYRITQSYYDGHSDKRQALRDILTIGNFQNFLTASGYPAKFP
jgi:hypothetical protein